MNTLAKTDNLSTRLAHALVLIDEAIQDASQRLASGPDNPAIRRHSPNSGLVAFSINFSELMRPGRTAATSLNPFSHDWLAQYRYARELVIKRKFSALRNLLAGGSYYDPSHGVRIFADEVIEHVKAITGDLRAAVELTDANRMSEGLVAAGLATASSSASARRPRMGR